MTARLVYDGVCSFSSKLFFLNLFAGFLGTLLPDTDCTDFGPQITFVTDYSASFVFVSTLSDGDGPSFLTYSKMATDDLMKHRTAMA